MVGSNLKKKFANFLKVEVNNLTSNPHFFRKVVELVKELSKHLRTLLYLQYPPPLPLLPPTPTPLNYFSQGALTLNLSSEKTPNPIWG